jgi:hypothetical protein
MSPSSVVGTVNEICPPSKPRPMTWHDIVWPQTFWNSALDTAERLAARIRYERLRGWMGSSLSLRTRCWWRSWLRHCATSRKVADSIPDGVTGIVHWHNPSGRTMTLGSTQPLTEMSTKNILWGIKTAGTLPPSCADCLEIWKPQLPGTLWRLFRPVNGTALPFSFTTLILDAFPAGNRKIFLQSSRPQSSHCTYWDVLAILKVFWIVLIPTEGYTMTQNNKKVLRRTMLLPGLEFGTPLRRHYKQQTWN